MRRSLWYENMIVIGGLFQSHQENIYIYLHAYMHTASHNTRTGSVITNRNQTLDVSVSRQNYVNSGAAEVTLEKREMYKTVFVYRYSLGLLFLCFSFLLLFSVIDL